MAERPDPTRALASRQLLLGLLADRDALRRGSPARPEQVEQTLRWYRAHYGLLRRAELDAFLRTAGLGEAALGDLMRTFTNIGHAQQRHAERVERLQDRYRAIFSVKDWVLQREAEREGARRS